tara:strand:- start:488 stop:757 length:270 start_codon:yes stop_codon:yes gene_type:complete
VNKYTKHFFLLSIFFISIIALLIYYGNYITRIQNRNDVWFSKDGINYQELPNTPWKERHASSVFIHNNSLFVIAGNNMESDVWKLTKTK